MDIEEIKFFDVIIDLRSRKEFEKDLEFYKLIGVKNAINIDFFDAPKQISDFDKSKSYLLVCESGTLSEIIQNIMKSKGFQKVSNLENGMSGLKKKFKKHNMI